MQVRVGRLAYFAYGSNMPRARLVERVGEVELLGPARLDAHRLHFHKRGRDGSGKCDVAPADDVVHGALFLLEPAQLQRLHDFEGAGYECVCVGVRLGSDVLEARTYRALPAHVDPGLLPFDWYLDLVRAGAEQLGLPARYRSQLASIRATPDPDTERAARHRALLA